MIGDCPNYSLAIIKSFLVYVIIKVASTLCGSLSVLQKVRKQLRRLTFTMKIQKLCHMYTNVT